MWKICIKKDWKEMDQNVNRLFQGGGIMDYLIIPFSFF